MVFSSLFFLYFFLPLVLLLHFISNNKIYRDSVLLLASLTFYAWGEPVWVLILILTVFMDNVHGRIAEKYRGGWQSKAALLSSIIMNLSLLGFFKYWGFIIANINAFLGSNIPYREFALPLGISFYTFQTLSYVIDVYRGEVAAQKSPFKQLLYVSMFHQLVAGPIVRYKDIAEQLEKRVITLAAFNYGIHRFIIGLGKKVILANTAGELSDLFLQGNIQELSVLGAWYGMIVYSLQIYFDFSGYSDMAIGLGKMFGFTYKENFNYPYIAKSVSDFWRRWHISLGSFFRDYVYIPLGGNKRCLWRNLLVVWFLTGLWHGASWNFVIWGLYYGALISVERIFLAKLLERLRGWVAHLYLLMAVVVGWVFFYFTDLNQCLSLLRVMFGLTGAKLADINFYIHFSNNLGFLILAVLACAPTLQVINGQVQKLMGAHRLTAAACKQNILPIMNWALLLISTVLLVGKSYNPFLYFRF